MLKRENIEWIGEPKIYSWDDRKNIGVPFKVKSDKRTLYLDGYNIYENSACDISFMIHEYLGEDTEVYKGEIQTNTSYCSTNYDDIEGVNDFVIAILDNEKVIVHKEWFLSPTND